MTPKNKWDIKLGVFTILAICIYYDYAKSENFLSAAFFISLGGFITYLTIQSRTQK